MKTPPYARTPEAGPTAIHPAPHAAPLTWDDFLQGLSGDGPVIEARAALGRQFQE